MVLTKIKPRGRTKREKLEFLVIGGGCWMSAVVSLEVLWTGHEFVGVGLVQSVVA